LSEKKASALIFILTLMGMASPAPAEMRSVKISTAAELQALLTERVDSLEIFIATGHYHLLSRDIVDSTCGNCQDPSRPVPATAGLVISGNYVRLFGPQGRWAVIHTHAGYGLFFDGCREGIIENLFITDGVRDPDPNATDAAIVAKNSTVTIRQCRIHDNIGDSSLVAEAVVGIMGICGRENSHLLIEDNELVRNSWDGIALYRDANAVIADNLIDGVDKATGKTAGGGRGVGIGVTWNAQATIEENLIRRYWKGIGIFVDAGVTARGNIVEDILTWGVAYWDAEAGKPVGFIESNVIYSTGACGISIHRAASGPVPGHLIGNVIVRTAQNPKYDDPDYYCRQCALSISALPDGFDIADNLFFDNRRATEDLPDEDVSEEVFRARAEEIKEKLLVTPLLRGSDFAQFLSEVEQSEEEVTETDPRS
jgi:hypothetical protein